MIGSGPIEEPTDPRLLAVTAYAGSRHGECIIRGLIVLNHLHRPDGDDLRCPTCRDSRGRRVPWPCRTYIEMSRALGADAQPILELADTIGVKVAPLLDIDAIVAADRKARWERNAIEE
ncbi:hypothetical protein ACFFMN_22975 [Planobispora siamensis]|uniref:Uncharacterized protein n=1 Tax=Planobispora siamensis TaxID=936338 RepID=A0A8J3WQ40_9ACTN|nr:hypothetical protein [Planobispora siamensis]GIH95431.1 hypothetical protein Psi01_60610 [Planobispora siamensis]